MSSLPYPALAQAVPVDQAMPPPSTAPNQYLHALGQALHDMHSQQQQMPAPAPAAQNNNMYSPDATNNPYAIAPSHLGAGVGNMATSAFGSLADKLG